MTELKGSIEQIGPKEANEILLKHDFNRPLRRTHVLQLARQMIQNLWQSTGEPIIIDKNGQLQDGQHRLRAVIHSGKTIPFYVVRGTEEEAFLVMDTGQKRNYRDALYIAGFTQPLLYGGLAGKLIKWERMIYFGGKVTALAPTNAEIVQYCEDHRKEMAESINYLLQVQNRIKKLVGGGNFIFCYHLCKQKSETQAFDFFERLSTGQGLKDNKKYQPIEMLRNRLTINMNDDAKLPAKLICLMIFGAWNAYRQSKKLNQLKGTIDLKAAVGKKIEIY